ncbi:ArnT family glycosyltransferase [Algoriphagus machipongonensis]|nr:glycosyltransferase family 39 protein [Algoriphagus machipongonensis]
MKPSELRGFFFFLPVISMWAKFSYRTTFWIASLAIVLVKIIFLFRPEIDLFTEEAQYWLWSRNLAWHYYSKPPLVAYLNLITTSVFGITEFAVRFNATAFGLGTAWIAYRFGTYLFNPKVGFWAAMILQAMPFWWLISTFHTTDSSVTFFWSLSIYMLYRGINEEQRKWWIIAGLSAALGLMAKVVMVLIFPLIFLFLLQAKTLKKHSKNLVIFTLVSFLGFIPVLVWNFENNFDTFKHIANLAGAGEGESKPFDFGAAMLQFLAYLGGQLAMFSIFLLPLVFASLSKLFKPLSQIKIYLLLPVAATFMAFGALSFLTEALVNWPIFTYMTFSVFISSWLVNQTGAWLKWRNWGIAVSLAFPLLLLLPDFTFIKSIPAVKKGEMAAFKRMSGYEPLANRIEFLKDSLSLKEEFIFSDTYHMASELSFYLEGNPQTFMVNMGSRKNQFDLWEGMEQFVGQENVGIFVSWNYDSPGDFARFDSLLYEESFPIAFRGEPFRVAKIQVWKNLSDFNPYQPETY